MDPAASVEAGVVPGGVAASAPAGAAAPAATAAVFAHAAAARQVSTQNARRALAEVLFVLGKAMVVLALSAMAGPPARSRSVGACALTDEEAADLRAASEQLLLPALAQVIWASVAMLAPSRLFAATGCLLGGHTAYHASDVLWQLVACHGHVHGAVAFHYWLLVAMLPPALLVGLIVALR